MQSILERLNAGEILVADGAMGSILFQKGLQPGECPESMNLSHPEILEEIAASYFQAGADIVQTNTFGASPLKLSDSGLEEQTEKINVSAVSFVKKVVENRAYISGSVGPTGRILEPYGDTKEDLIYLCFERQIKALIDGGVNIITVETMLDLREASLAIRAAKTISPETPVMATMTFDETPRGFFTLMGVSTKEAANGLESAGADIIGSNCGSGIETMVKIAQELQTFSTLPLIIQSNAGHPEIRNGKQVYLETPEFFADKARELIESGVSIIGGCCGTTPEHIQAIRKVVDSLKKTDLD